MRRFCTSLHYCTSQSGLSNAQLSWNKLNDTIHCKQYKIKYSTKSTLQPAMPFSNLNLGRLVKLSGEQVPDFSPCVLKYMKFPQKKHQFMKLGPAMYVGFHCSKSSIKCAMFAKRGEMPWRNSSHKLHCFMFMIQNFSKMWPIWDPLLESL